MCADRVLDMGAENRVIFERPFTEPGYKLRKFEDIAKILSGARLNNLGRHVSDVCLTMFRMESTILRLGIFTPHISISNLLSLPERPFNLQQFGIR